MSNLKDLKVVIGKIEEAKTIVENKISNISLKKVLFSLHS